MSPSRVFRATASICASLVLYFVLTRSAFVTTVTIWGAYFPNDDPVPTDSFTVILRSNSAGAPGAVIHTETVAAPRLLTGAAFGTIDEYEYVLRLATPPELAAGTYWVELFNKTGQTSNFT